jgi:hypothetical protein
LESGDRFGPEGAKTFLASLAAEANESGSIQLQIACPDIEEFLYTGARVEHSEQQRLITDVIPPMGQDGSQHGADFFAFQVIYSAYWSTLDGYGQEALSLFHLLGITRCEETSE